MIKVGTHGHLEPIWYRLEHSESPSYSKTALEPAYYTEWQLSTWEVPVLWNKGPLKVLNSMKLILDNQGNLESN